MNAVTPHQTRGLRPQKPNSQKQFAIEYHINLETLKNWEQHKRIPDTTSLAYLTCIAQRPKLIRDLLKRG
ncbi:MAG: hypothetical protein DHS20C10_07590 [marine bacterium B5-7]|nr:MAG: hypothetical protein DHS20C10_07590 [marine bacterium B5-7]